MTEIKNYLITLKNHTFSIHSGNMQYLEDPENDACLIYEFANIDLEMMQKYIDELIEYDFSFKILPYSNSPKRVTLQIKESEVDNFIVKSASKKEMTQNQLMNQLIYREYELSMLKNDTDALQKKYFDLHHKYKELEEKMK